ncbi:MAG TPA: cupin domain-containing protein [Allosphingosinicella sp.]|nr:cupin domain-containing protein [Allosphingosinicella sp.]
MRIGKAMGICAASVGFALRAASPLHGQPPQDPTAFVSGPGIGAAVAAMGRDMKPDQGFLWRPLLRGGSAVAALEYWRKPAKPAVHPDEAEYVIVVEGAGTMVSGGTLVDARETNPNLVEGSRIEGGTTRALHPGDAFLIPAGTPHWFGITGDRLVLLGTKIPQPRH